MTTYESVLKLVGSVPSAVSAGLRDVRWLTDGHTVGVARDHDGHVEVFLAGPQLSPVSPAVADALEFSTWHRDGAPALDASRLLLPALGHYDQVAAFICTELLRNGADVSLPRAFARTEPIIELAIERLRLSDQAVLGLAGELLLLDALCRRADDAQVLAVVGSWDGWRRSSRDFTLGSTGVEVKTTGGVASSHLVEGVHQVELADGTSGGTTIETRLYLVSIGLQAASSGGNAFTIPHLVDRVVARMTSASLNDDAVNTFLSRLSEYGGVPNGGYDHAAGAGDLAYATPYLVTFFRAYNMADPAVRVLRRHDIVDHAHVDVGSVKFRVDLPITISAGNPVSGANQVARAIIG
ncbi:PD-(D/E)XK motif protein [Cellulosimicrobium sp. E-16]|uniref:PD-(D/E)XK motif protein n=1 Tax=Cellulosimicrobium sp. E-16 TaxID=3404049 RepID=UPI003CF42499